jgi:hypothetical protein
MTRSGAATEMTACTGAEASIAYAADPEGIGSSARTVRPDGPAPSDASGAAWRSDPTFRSSVHPAASRDVVREQLHVLRCSLATGPGLGRAPCVRLDFAFRQWRSWKTYDRICKLSAGRGHSLWELVRLRSGYVSERFAYHAFARISQRLQMSLEPLAFLWRQPSDDALPWREGIGVWCQVE